MRHLLLFSLGLLFSLCVQAQVVFEPITSSVYDFLDELANQHVIELNTAVKPYARMLIAEKLQEAEEQQDELTPRQQKELAFYLKDFGKETHEGKDWDRRIDLYYFDNDKFTFTFNPVFGGKLFLNDSGSVFKRYSGAEAWSYLGDKVGISASLRDNNTTSILAEHNFLTQEKGGNYKLNQDGQLNGRSDWSETMGSITYGWKWGSIGLIKEDFTWGNNYNGANIFSGRSPSFARLQFKANPAKWFDFNYIHGWLISEVLDSTRTYLVPGGQQRQVQHDKFIAANFFTFTPIQKVSFSIGNSVVYSDVGIRPEFLIPVLFYKSADATITGAGSSDLGQNSQFFFDLSIRKIKKLHLYTSVFFDELSISNFNNPERHTNLYSGKLGVRATNVIPNTAVTFEYTRTNPWTFQHNIEVNTFASNQFTLGHYLLDNAEEVFTSIRFKPFRGFVADLSYTRALKGPEVDYMIINGEPNVIGLKWLESITWKSQTTALKLNYEVINGGFAFLQVISSDIEGNPTYTPNFFRGNQTTIMGGMNFGF